ncbi:MAG: lipopolysaccharide kinase InaA family protein [Phycisphaerae bacterium]
MTTNNGNDQTQYTWKFSTPTLSRSLNTDTFDWSNPASIPGAQLIKENGQRQVWRVDLGENSYYAKLYLRNGKSWQIKRYFRGPACLKEWTVANYALEHGINCVIPLAYAVSSHTSLPLREPSPVDSLLITAGIQQALPLTDYWQLLNAKPGDANRAAQIDTLEDALAELLARAHLAGLAHSDLHPGNLLVEQKRHDHKGVNNIEESSCTKPFVCLVDLQAVRVGTPVSDREAIDNLAQLNQWFRQNATLTQRMRLLKKYMLYRKTLAHPKGRQWSNRTFKHWARALDRAAHRHAKKLLASRDRRVMRNCKYFAKLNLPNRWQAHVFLKTRHPLTYSSAAYMEFSPDHWKNVLSAPEKMLDEFVKSLRPIKNSRSTLVCRGTLQVGNHSLSIVAKRHIRRKRFAALWNCLRKSRSLRAWKMSFAMLHRQLPVALPLAVLERRIGPYLADSIFITEEVKPSINLRLFITSILPLIPLTHRRRITFVLIDQLAALLRKMHQNSFTHRDMKATNILIHNMPSVYDPQIDPKSLQIVLVDLDGLRIKHRPSERDKLRALVRLSLSSDLSPCITQSDRARFLKNYLTCYGSGIPDWKSLWRKIQLEREKSFQDHIPG